MNEEHPATGGIKSPVDYRRIYISQLGLPEELPLSYFIDISNLGVLSQRKIGACVGHAAAQYKKKLDETDTGNAPKISARFLYALAKARDNYAGEGTYPSLVAKILQEVGCATEDTCPNDTTLTHEEYVYQRDEKNMPKEAMDEAYKAKIGGYAWVLKDIQSIKQSICKASGSIALMRVGKEWWTDKNGISTYDTDRLCPIQPPKEVISGHEIYLCGYETLPNDDLKIYFLNSWDKKWCTLGVGYFLFSEYKNFLDEMITFIDIPNKLLEEAHNKPKQFSYHFKRTIKLGERSEEVKNLQRALTMTKDFDYEITGYFGSITQDALLAFQLRNCQLTWYEKYILRGSICGPKTLSALNKQFNI
jgi:hypothetical protein